THLAGWVHLNRRLSPQKRQQIFPVKSIEIFFEFRRSAPMPAWHRKPRLVHAAACHRKESICHHAIEQGGQVQTFAFHLPGRPRRGQRSPLLSLLSGLESQRVSWAM